MKKSILIIGTLLAVASVSAQAYDGHHAEVPGFQDHFTITLGTGIPAAIKVTGTTGTIKNISTPSCSGNSCTFTITDNNKWSSYGTLSYLVGDATEKGPYCMITITDGALYPEATMNSTCMNGASATTLEHNGYNYTFSINDQK